MMIQLYFILLSGCQKVLQPDSISTQAKQVTQDIQAEREILQSWKGRINVPSERQIDAESQDIPLTNFLVIRDTEAMNAFVARIPKFEIQKMRPSPKSSDPFLKGVEIDFYQEMLLVMIRNDSMYVHAPIKRLVGNDVRVTVQFELESLGETTRYSAPDGVGTYVAVKNTRYDGTLVPESL